MAITNLISNKHVWNNCFIKFGTVVYLEIRAKFYKIIFDKKFISVPLKLAVSALELVRAGYVELIAGQFLSQGQKIS